MRTNSRIRGTGLVLLALAGLAVAVALSVAARNLSNQPVGLSDQPLRPGQTLAPAVENPVVTHTVRVEAKPRTPTKTSSQGTTLPTTPTATAPSKDPYESREREPTPDDD